MTARPTFFATPEAFHDWLAAHHDRADDILVGFYKTKSGRPSMTWPQSVEVALCFGWIDGKRKGIDAERYSIRFTPRRARAIWSTINIRKAEELIAAGRMTDAGRRAFEVRDETRSRIYAYEQVQAATLSARDARALRANRAAWTWFSSQPRWYQRNAAYWISAAKKQDTHDRRLAMLIADSAAGRLVNHLTPPGLKAKATAKAKAKAKAKATDKVKAKATATATAMTTPRPRRGRI